MANIEAFREEEVTQEKLEDLFKQAFMSTTIDRDGDLVVESEQVNTFVHVIKGNNLIKYAAYFAIDESYPEKDKYELANRMNRQIVFCRFSVEKKALVCDYFLPYEEGISKFQIISSIRLFGKIIPSAIKSCDDIGLVK